MGKNIFTTFISCVFTVCNTLGCVVTGPAQNITEGFDVHLSCNFTECFRTMGNHQLNVEWDFEDENERSFIYHYENQTVTTDPRVVLVGIISKGDFSVLLKSVTIQDSGTYLCRLRVNGNPNIKKNYTQITVKRSDHHKRNKTHRQGDVHEPDLTYLDWLFPLSCVLGLLCLVGGVILGMWVRRRRSQQQQDAQGQIEAKLKCPGNTQEANGNKTVPALCNTTLETSGYDTLQKFRAPPPPAPSKGDGIYVSMHGPSTRPPGPQPDTYQPCRMTLPEAWTQLETPNIAE